MKLHSIIPLLVLLVYIQITSTLDLPVDAPEHKFEYDLRLATALFHRWISDFNKTFTDEEKIDKFKIFSENLRRINAINRNFKGDWDARITQHAGSTYLDFLKENNVTKEEDLGVDRDRVNCTDRPPYLIERFA